MPSSRASLGSNTVADTWRRNHFQRPQRDAAQYVLVQLRHPAVNALMLPYHSPSATNVFDVEPGGTSQHKEPNDDRRKPPIWMLRDQSCASPKSIVGSTRHAGGIYYMRVVTVALSRTSSWKRDPGCSHYHISLIASSSSAKSSCPCRDAATGSGCFEVCAAIKASSSSSSSDSSSNGSSGFRLGGSITWEFAINASSSSSSGPSLPSEGSILLCAVLKFVGAFPSPPCAKRASSSSSAGAVASRSA